MFADLSAAAFAASGGSSRGLGALDRALSGGGGTGRACCTGLSLGCDLSALLPLMKNQWHSHQMTFKFLDGILRSILIHTDYLHSAPTMTGSQVLPWAQVASQGEACYLLSLHTALLGGASCKQASKLQGGVNSSSRRPFTHLHSTGLDTHYSCGIFMFSDLFL